MPGMSCAIRFITYSKPDAITVPSKAVHVGAPGAKSYVLLAGKMTKKRFVTTGRTVGTKIEILKGLKPGEKVLLDQPAESSKDDE
jgi:membrane fusion protein, multidrug efflux system